MGRKGREIAVDLQHRRLCDLRQTESVSSFVLPASMPHAASIARRPSFLAASQMNADSNPDKQSSSFQFGSNNTSRPCCQQRSRGHRCIGTHDLRRNRLEDLDATTIANAFGLSGLRYRLKQTKITQLRYARKPTQSFGSVPWKGNPQDSPTQKREFPGIVSLPVRISIWHFIRRYESFQVAIAAAM